MIIIYIKYALLVVGVFMALFLVFFLLVGCTEEDE